MANWFTTDRFTPLAPQSLLRAASAAMVALSLWAGPTLAKDPFRTTNPRPIGDQTENAFRAVFEQGNYTKAIGHIQQAEPNEPLAYAMKASMAYIAWDGEKDDQKKAGFLEQYRSYASQTRDAARALLPSDPLRGNLYLAVGHFLEGGYIVLKEGTVKGTPKVLGEVQRAFKYLDTAEASSPNDPELNLIKGYMDLFMSINLPFSSPSQAIERLEKHAGPRYLADRGIALGYRDLKQPDRALVAIDRAIKSTPDNPELYYLKAQILVQQGKHKDSVPLFERALTKREQLPAGLVTQIEREMSRAKRRAGIS